MRTIEMRENPETGIWEKYCIDSTNQNEQPKTRTLLEIPDSLPKPLQDFYRFLYKIPPITNS